jgi:hypothetical protein
MLTEFGGGTKLEAFGVDADFCANEPGMNASKSKTGNHRDFIVIFTSGKSNRQ